MFHLFSFLLCRYCGFGRIRSTKAQGQRSIQIEHIASNVYHFSFHRLYPPRGHLLHGWSTLIGIGRRIELSMQASPMDAAAFLQLADDDSLYTNVAAMLTGPQDQLIRAPDASFAWSPCTYTLTTSEGSWPISMSSAPPCVDMHAVPQPYRTCG